MPVDIILKDIEWDGVNKMRVPLEGGGTQDFSIGGGTATLQTKSKTYTPTASQQTESVQADNGYDGLDTVNITVNAMPSGTEGTPTATKGTVSNHSVTVTPSVTNTAGYISGGTRTGNPVTVFASELVSGSETKTANGTYDVTNLAELIVNVPLGLEYETGTWIPTEDITRGTVNFARTHSEAPVVIVMADVDETPISTSNSNHSFIYFDYYKLWGHGIPYTATGFRYTSVAYNYRGTSTTQITTGGVVLSQNSDSTSDASASYPRYWAKPDSFYPYTYNTSRYWRANRTYKWLAIWK